MTTRFRWAAAGTIFGLAAALSLPSLAQQPSPPVDPTNRRTVSVNGMAIITSTPDEAVISVGVQTEAPSARQALSDNAAKMTKVIDALISARVDRDDIATSSVGLNPSYGVDGLQVTGYTAVNQVTATVRDLSTVGSVIDEAVAAGANLASGVTFQLSDQNQGLDQALAAAVADARSKADALAAASGARLGQVVSVTEVSSGGPPPTLYAGREDASVATPIVPGDVETHVSVNVIWELVD